VLATPNNKLIYVSASRPLEIPVSFPHILQDSNTSDLFFFSFACVCCKKKKKKYAPTNTCDFPFKDDGFIFSVY
jgi:hypothetical protein